MGGHELALVEWLRRRQRAVPAVVLGIGDDMAIVDIEGSPHPGCFLISSDMLLDGVHFDTNAIQYIQGNIYGLSELQKLVGEKLGLKCGTYHHFIDSLIVSKAHYKRLEDCFMTISEDS